jgi:drug/metabolite transporter (DMT)-like permease
MKPDHSLPPGLWIMGLSVLCSAFGPALVRLSPVDAAATAFWRLAFCLLPALLLAYRAARQSDSRAAGWTALLPALPRRDVGLALLAGLLYAGDLVLWNGAILRTTILEASMLVMIYPVLVALIGVTLLAQQAGWRLWAGCGCCFGGIALMSLHRDGGQSDLTGNAMALGAALFYAVSFLVTADLSRRHAAATVAFWESLGATFGTLPIALTEPRFLPATAQGWAFMAVYAALTLMSMLALNRALRTLPTAMAATLGYGMPVLATLLAALIFGEWPGAVAVAGGAIIVCGLALTTRDKPRQTRVTA